MLKYHGYGLSVKFDVDTDKQIWGRPKSIFIFGFTPTQFLIENAWAWKLKVKINFGCPQTWSSVLKSNFVGYSMGLARRLNIGEAEYCRNLFQKKFGTFVEIGIFRDIGTEINFFVQNQRKVCAFEMT